MTRLIAFHIIGGTKHQPITKMILARDPDPSNGAATTTYFFVVGKHEGYFTDSVFPSNEGENLYFASCGGDLHLAENVFSECTNMDVVRKWQQDDASSSGEDRLFQRAQP